MASNNRLGVILRVSLSFKGEAVIYTWISCDWLSCWCRGEVFCCSLQQDSDPISGRDSSLACISSMNSPKKSTLAVTNCQKKLFGRVLLFGGRATVRCSQRRRCLQAAVRRLHLSQSDSERMKTIGGGGDWLPGYTEHLVLLKMNTVGSNHWNVFFGGHVFFC